MNLLLDSTKLDASACSQIHEDIFKETEAKFRHWAEQCKGHHNEDQKITNLRADMFRYKQLANRLLDVGSPEKLMDLLDQVRAYDPR